MYSLTKYLLDVTVRNIYRYPSAYNCALYEHEATPGMAGHLRDGTVRLAQLLP